MILYIENPKDATRKPLVLINESGKVAGYKIKAQKSLASLYTSKERSEKETNETTPFTKKKKKKSVNWWAVWQLVKLKQFHL